MSEFILEGDALDRLQKAAREFGYQKALAEKAGLPQATLSQMLSKGGDVTVSRLGKLASALGKPIDYFLTGESADHAPTSVKRAVNDDVISIREIDLTFGMGATYLEIPVTETMHDFPREWVRAYTRAEPDRLYFAQGIGDSMASTILDSDLLLIDASQNHLNMGDKIWAISCGEVGMVKRLRSNPGGSVTVLSDNPLVPPFDVVDGEMSILGRVVAIVRKM